MYFIEACSICGVMTMDKHEYWLTDEGLITLEGWARDGLTDEDMAHNMGINPATLYDWKKKYPKISEALKNGKEVVDYRVENALLNNALCGDTTAQIFWLKNRRPDKWRDKQNLELVTKEQEARIAQMKAQTDKIVRESGDSEEDGVEIINDAPKETG